MPVTADRMHAFDHSIGEIHEPARGIKPLAYNIIMMRLGKITLGTRKWWNAFFDVMHMLEYDEIVRICAGHRIPHFIAKRLNPQHKAWINSVKNNPAAKRTGKAPTHNSRVSKALQVLRNAPPSQLGFLTIVTDFAGSESDAIQQVTANASRLSSFLRRRFDHPVCILFPEVDQKVAKTVNDALLPRAGWKVAFDPKQRIHKIHFHGLIYVPGHSPADIERAIKYHAGGKRNRQYSGANQVRVIPVNEAPGYNDGSADIDGVAGYSTKYHYKPPVMARMLEGFISWLLVTSAIINDPKATVVIGVRNGIQVYCGACETYHCIDSECACPSILTSIPLDDFYSEPDQPSKNVSNCPIGTGCCSSDQPEDASLVHDIVLNSLPLSIWKSVANSIGKKSDGLIRRSLAWQHSLLQNVIFPRGP